MKRHILPIAVLLAVTLYAQQASAIFGIGDVVFDPTNYGQIAETVAQLEQMYKTLSDQYTQLVSIEQTIAKANQAYDNLTNLSLHDLTNNLKAGAYGNSNGLNNLAAMRAAITRAGGGLSADSTYVTSQLSRLDDLATLVGLQNASATNLENATTDPDTRKSTQVVAQSTTVLAAIATAQEQRAVLQQVAQSADQKQFDDVRGAAANLLIQAGSQR